MASFGLIGCRDNNQVKPSVQAGSTTYRIHTVEAKQIASRLGLQQVQPLELVVITAPFEGRGESVLCIWSARQAGATAFQIKSEELSKQYRKNVTDYLKAKNAYLMAQNKFQGSKQLYQANLINRNELKKKTGRKYLAQ